MKNAKVRNDDVKMRDEYDFSNAVRGKYAKKFAKGTNIVVLEPDVAKVFRNSKRSERDPQNDQPTGNSEGTIGQPNKSLEQSP